MRKLASGLNRYVERITEPGRSRARSPIKVVVKLKSAPSYSMRRVPNSGKGLKQALSVMETAGIWSGQATLAGFRPHQISATHSSVMMEVAANKLEELAGNPDVEYVRPLRIHRQHLIDSAPILGVDARVRSKFRGRGFTVAVIDSGIDPDHPDFEGRVLTSKSRNFSSEGTVKDITDRNGHGTHVAGIIGGNGRTYRGVASEVRFIACKVFDADGKAEEGSIIAAVRWAIEQGADVINFSGGYAPIMDHPTLGQLILVDPPWVWPEEPIEEEVEFIRAMDAGVVSVVSAGNEGEVGRRGTLSMPATTPAVISVGSIDKGRRLSGFSSVGPAFRSSLVPPQDAPMHLSAKLQPDTVSFRKVDLVAPGGGVDPVGGASGGCFYSPGIISTRAADGSNEEACRVGDGYTLLSGTSQAAPHVAGLAALTLEAARELKVNLGSCRAHAIKGILASASRRLSVYTLHEQGKGLPDWSSIEAILKDLRDGVIMISELAGT